MRYVIMHDDQFVSHIHWVAIYIPYLKYSNELNDATVLKEEYLDLFEEKVGKTKWELIKEKYPDAKLRGVNVVLNPIK